MTDAEIEVWAVIADDPLYEVSNLARVRRKARTVMRRSGPMTVSGGLLTQTVHSAGYFSVRLRNRHRYVHRLVAAAFIRPPLEGETVNHLDGNKKNNALSNLEWCSMEANIRHAFETGLMNVDKRPPPANKPPPHVGWRAKALYAAGVPMKELERQFGESTARWASAAIRASGKEGV
jgi:hypothetical protein